jgi:hypothetical protein
MMGRVYLAHDETGGEQYIISVVETLHCYHKKARQHSSCHPRIENSVKGELDCSFLKLGNPTVVIADQAVNGL